MDQIYVDENDLELKLIAGMPIEIENVGLLKPLKLKEIIAMGESKYNKLLSHLLFDKHSEELLKDAEESNFDLVLILTYTNEYFRNNIFEAFKMFFNEDIHLSDDGFFYFGDISEKRIVDEDKFNLIRFVLQKENHIKTNSEPEFNPANEMARKMMEKIIKNRKKRPQKKSNITLHSLISGLAWRSSGISIFNVFDLTVYQLYNGFYRLENIDYYQSTLNGIYSGNVDPKKINLNEINWAKAIKLKT